MARKVVWARRRMVVQGMVYEPGQSITSGPLYEEAERYARLGAVDIGYMPDPDWDRMTVAELKRAAKGQGIAGANVMRRVELLEALRQCI